MKNKKDIIKNTKILLDADVSDVFVVQNSKRRAYIEQFKHRGVNFTQKKLGTFFGFFIVRDSSDASANIVNFLTAEVKKEYFAFPKRGIAESFETSLHRINRALAEIVNVGNVDWLGTIDGVVCAIDETMMYFSVTGEARVLLMRGENIMDISDGLASEEARQHPLKTFVDISTGELVAGDKIIITSPELLDLLSLEELQRDALRLGQDKFIQFINTVLVNECKLAATSVIDISEKTTISIDNAVQNKISNNIINGKIEEDIDIPDNIFSAEAFRNDDQLDKGVEDAVDEDVDELLDDEKIKQDGEYTDKRTGHIYLQGDENEEASNHIWSATIDNFKDLTYDIKMGTQKKVRRMNKKVKLFIESRKEKPAIQVDSASVTNIQNNSPFDDIVDDVKTVNVKGVNIEEKINVSYEKKLKQQKNNEAKIEDFFKKDDDVVEKNKSKKNKIKNDKTSTENKFNKIEKVELKSKQEEKNDSENTFLLVMKKVAIYPINIFSRLFKAIFKKGEKSKKLDKDTSIDEVIKKQSESKQKSDKNIFNSTKQSWFKLGRGSKIGIVIAIIVILIVPVIFMSSSNNGESGDIGQVIDSEQNEQNAETQGEHNIPVVTNDQNNLNDIDEKIEGNINDPEILFEGESLIYSDQMNQYLLSVDREGVIILNDENTKYSLPDNVGTIQYATVMDDLNLVFLLTDKNQLFSFSPISKEFKKQSVSGGIKSAKVEALDTYMTYLYMFGENKISRHARQEEGFATGVDWLKEDYVIKNVSDTSINENIYIAQNKTVDALSQGKKMDLSLDDKKESDLIYVKNLQYLWVLSKTDSSIYKFDKITGKLLETFTHNDIKNAISFAVNEKTKQAILNTENKVNQFKLEIK